MRAILTVAIMLIAQFSIGQVSKNLGDFNAVKVFDRISVELRAADENKISVSGTRSNEVEIVNKNGDLHIRMPLKKLLQGESITAILYYKKIESIIANEGSMVSASGPFKQSSLDLSAKEGSEIRLSVEADKVNVKAVTGGIVSLNGEVVTQSVAMGTGGIYKAKKLISKKVEISINAGGDAEIYATEQVDATVRAGGNIDVYGNPKELNEKIVIGGSVRRAE